MKQCCMQMQDFQDVEVTENTLNGIMQETKRESLTIRLQDTLKECSQAMKEHGSFYLWEGLFPPTSITNLKLYKMKNTLENELNPYKVASKKNALSRESMLQGKLYRVKEMLHELIEVGEDYSVFQSAQITHKNLKKAYKLLQGLS